MNYMKFDYVYFAKAGNAMKIGVAKSPLERIKTLQTGCPDKIILITVIPSYNAEEYEKELHEKFVDKRINGEWFEGQPVWEWLLDNALPEYDIKDLLDNFMPETYWMVVGERSGKYNVFRQIKVRLMDSSISLVKFCNDTKLPFEEIISA